MQLYGFAGSWTWGSFPGGSQHAAVVEKYRPSLVVGLRSMARTDIFWTGELGVKPTLDDWYLLDGLVLRTLGISASELNVGIRIYEDKFSWSNDVHRCFRIQNDPITAALNGGELWITIHDPARLILRKVKVMLTFTWLVTFMKGQWAMWWLPKEMVPLQAQGWNHFSSWSERQFNRKLTAFTFHAFYGKVFPVHLNEFTAQDQTDAGAFSSFVPFVSRLFFVNNFSR